MSIRGPLGPGHPDGRRQAPQRLRLVASPGQLRALQRTWPRHGSDVRTRRAGGRSGRPRACANPLLIGPQCADNAHYRRFCDLKTARCVRQTRPDEPGHRSPQPVRRAPPSPVAVIDLRPAAAPRRTGRGIGFVGAGRRRTVACRIGRRGGPRAKALPDRCCNCCRAGGDRLLGQRRDLCCGLCPDGLGLEQLGRRTSSGRFRRVPTLARASFEEDHRQQSDDQTDHAQGNAVTERVLISLPGNGSESRSSS